MSKNVENKDIVSKVLPNMDLAKLLVLQYNPTDGATPSFLTVATDKVENGKNVGLRAISCFKGDEADKIYGLLTGYKNDQNE